ncbi:MAG: NAD(P)/FAD-dependent oxidoreductase [Spirochaetota bacterium]|nr:NAD(P)/FAD-dependent oxidoreductase [Spirochaetota bacterium]
MKNTTQYDAIIIGAGLGGLTTAGILAKKGKKVLILEQHNIPGGCATCYPRLGVTIDVGLHELDWGSDNENLKIRIFKKLGIYEKIPFVSINECWSYKTPTHSYTIPHGRENVKEFLKNNFPKEEKGIDAYFKDMQFTALLAHKTASDMNFWEFLCFPFKELRSMIKNLLVQENTGDKLDFYFKSNEIKAVLLANNGYYADDPYNLSWFYHCAGQYAYYNSSKYIKGGGQTLSNLLLDVVLENNGEIRYLKDVHKIELEGNKAVGVTYTDRKTKENVTVYGTHIVSNASPNSINKMIPAELEDQSVKGLKTNSRSIFSVYMITNKNLTDIYPDMSYTSFFDNDKAYTSELIEIEEALHNPCIGSRKFSFTNYGSIDSGLVPEGDPRTCAVFCGSSFLAEWDNLSKEEYKAKKEELAQKLFERIEQYYPDFRKHIEYYEVSTPKTIQRYIKTPHGSVYGYLQTGFFWNRKGLRGFQQRRAPRHSQSIQNLHYTGAWGWPGGGFTGAICSGYLAGNHIH